MPIAAHTSGGHSTLDVVLGIAILLWALASVSALLSWLTRLPRRYRQRAADHGRRRSRFARPRRRQRIGADADPGRSPDPRATSTAVEHNASPESDPSMGIQPRAAAESSGAVASGRPALVGPRCSPETLEPLAQSLDTSHRLGVAEARVADTLAALPSDRWLIERYALIGGHRIPFLVLGETGVFVICALTGPAAWDELRLPAQVADQHVMPQLPGYTGAIRVGLCRALAPPGIEPRWWCRPGEPGAWVMGLDWLIRWIEHFDRGHGLGVTDLRRLRELSQPKPGPVARVPDVVPRPPLKTRQPQPVWERNAASTPTR
jgi:hypothetical protein